MSRLIDFGLSIAFFGLLLIGWIWMLGLIGSAPFPLNLLLIMLYLGLSVAFFGHVVSAE